MKRAGAAVLAPLSDSVLRSPRVCFSSLSYAHADIQLMWGCWKGEFSVRGSQSGICVAMASRMMVQPEAKELADKAPSLRVVGVLVGRWWAVASWGGL